MISSAVIIILLFLRVWLLPWILSRNACDEYRWEARISQVCMFAFRFTAVLCDFLIYLISFIFHFLTVGRDGNFLQGNSQLSDHGRGKLLFDFGCVWFRQRRRKNVRNQRIGSSGEEQKDIKLKVVKSSSRFSIYFQLHFAFLLGVFRKCVSATLPADERRKWAKVEKPECVNAAC